MIDEVEPQFDQNVIDKFNRILDMCGVARGVHLSDIDFTL